MLFIIVICWNVYLDDKLQYYLSEEFAVLTPFCWCSTHKFPFIGIPDKMAKVLTPLAAGSLFLQSSHYVSSSLQKDYQTVSFPNLFQSCPLPQGLPFSFGYFFDFFVVCRHNGCAHITCLFIYGDKHTINMHNSGQD